ncbi:zinc finger protein 16-like [Lucilia sericata]|uniref:zinc finger protein 16-like n=1 Tax=Lucilia sericata TaxID=13632 RepID=UPI0018A82C46|nr:zinc finger protein 16-like [Lucilia sericata]
MSVLFPTSLKLHIHKYIHNPQKIIICDKCGKTYKNKSGLKLHNRREHSDEANAEKIPAECPICKKWYTSKLRVQDHIRNIHTNTDIEHRCNTCGFVSTTARALKKHILYNHRLERKHKCTLCEKAFKKASTLMEHRATHTGEPLYACPNCDQTFKSKANMFHHRRRLHKAEWLADRTKPPKEKYSRN